MIGEHFVASWDKLKAQTDSPYLRFTSSLNAWGIGQEREWPREGKRDSGERKRCACTCVCMCVRACACVQRGLFSDWTAPNLVPARV